MSPTRHTKWGLIIYLHERFKYKLKLKVNHCILVIYRQPKENLEFYNQFIDEFSPILGNLEKNNTGVILAGGFNIDLLKINDKIL